MTSPVAVCRKQKKVIHSHVFHLLNRTERASDYILCDDPFFAHHTEKKLIFTMGERVKVNFRR